MWEEAGIPKKTYAGTGRTCKLHSLRATGHQCQLSKLRATKSPTY